MASGLGPSGGVAETAGELAGDFSPHGDRHRRGHDVRFQGGHLSDGRRPGEPTGVADLGALPKVVAEVEQAVQSFQKRDFDACLRQLGEAVKEHPELPPPHALFAKLASLGNQGGLIRPRWSGRWRKTASIPRSTSFSATWP